ncbi:MAG: malectin domain-containing carbohydrate-binding protein [Chthoniobacteraceae bacterium]
METITAFMCSLFTRPDVNLPSGFDSLSKLSSRENVLSKGFNIPDSRIPLIRWLASLGDHKEWASLQMDDSEWISVAVPHNWDDYYGYHEVSHGNLHGTSWYRTRFDWDFAENGERLYAFFEGVGSYAQVFCNGQLMGKHAGGRTTFTIDLTPALHQGSNLLAVRADHPEKIADLPFVCGGCWGAPNTEGSQPFGIFRPAWLERTGPVRVEPFGVHIVTPEISEQFARVDVRTELCNASDKDHLVQLCTELLGPGGDRLWREECDIAMKPGEHRRITQSAPPLADPQLWGPGHPHLYRAVTTLNVHHRLSHRVETPFGLRWLEWPAIVAPETDDRSNCSHAFNPDVQPDGVAEPQSIAGGAIHILNRRESSPAGIVTDHSNVYLDNADFPQSASLLVEIILHGGIGTEAELFCEIQNGAGTVFFHQHRECVVFSETTLTHRWSVPEIYQPHQWTSDDPCLHRVVVELRSPTNHALWERSEIFFGIRSKEGSLNLATPSSVGAVKMGSRKDERKPLNDKILRLNGDALFINGTCEYENLLGCDHAFTEEQIAAEVAMMRSAGFNAFRDAHHPHNLRYYDHWDRLGMVCWTQMGSHIWFDTPEFRENYKRLVAEWVRERRNHPSVILWGVQNESSMPEDFVHELRDIIRELDPSSPQWRRTTTCNGGVGSDWNVPQEWSGTYGGNCNDYDLEAQQMVGEYGAWRFFGMHTEEAYCGDENDWSESWACYAMETKIRLGEAARDHSIGHFHWLFNTFPNPGRAADNYEGSGNAQIGSVNNKGLVTAWHQPSDLFYLFRANYADPRREPMVYIVSHTWPDRWKQPAGRLVSVFSNCEEVELFNGVGVRSLGKRKQPGRGRHFEWNAVEPRTNVLYAVGRVGGKEMARDIIALDHLPLDDSLSAWLGKLEMAPTDSGRPLFRISCGAVRETNDPAGRKWSADTPWKDGAAGGWVSWGNRFDNVPDDLASRGYTMTPVRGTYFPELYRTYRYGRNEFKYNFKLAPGVYRLRLHFAEPWFGVGGAADCRGWRLFDIAVNGKVLVRNLDIWSVSGGDHQALVREFDIPVEGDLLTLHFPCVRVGQALICGIEILELGMP